MHALSLAVHCAYPCEFTRMFSRLFVFFDALRHAIRFFARSTSYLNNARDVWTSVEESESDGTSFLRQSDRQLPDDKRDS